MIISIKTLMNWHRWAGLSVGVVLVMIAVTGAAMVFSPQLAPALDRELLTVAPCNERPSLDRLASVARAAHPVATLRYLWVYSEPYASVWARFNDNTIVYLHPCTAAVLGIRNRYSGVFGTLEKLHRLRFMPNSHLLAGTCAMTAALLLIVGGMVIWWPRRRSGLKAALRINTALSGRAFKLHLHRTVGVYASMILLTSAVTGLPQAFEWYRNVLYRITASPMSDAPPVMAAPPLAMRLPMEAMWRAAQTVVPAPRDAMLFYPQTPQEPVTVNLLERSAPHAEARSMLYLDAYTAQVLAFKPYQAGSAGDKLSVWLLALHKGEVGGVPIQLLLMAGGLSTSLLAWLGISSYIQQRRRSVRAPVVSEMSATEKSR